MSGKWDRGWAVGGGVKTNVDKCGLEGRRGVRMDNILKRPFA